MKFFNANSTTIHLVMNISNSHSN